MEWETDTERQMSTNDMEKNKGRMKGGDRVDIMSGEKCTFYVQIEVEKESNYKHIASEYWKDLFTEKQVRGVDHLLRSMAGLRILTIQVKY